MTRQVLLCAWFLFQVLAVKHPVMGAAAEKSGRSVFEGVKELEQPVSLSEAKIPLGELVEKIGTETKVKLVALPEVADEPVAVAVKELPARELLEQVAELLDYRWSRRGKEGAWRYEIWQDLAAKQREEALRKAAQADVEKRFREQTKQFVEMAALSQEEIQRIIDETERLWEERRKLSREEQEALLVMPEERERGRRWSTARMLWSPISRAIARLVDGLTPAQWATLREQGWLNFTTGPETGGLPMPEEIARSLRAARPGRDPKLTAGADAFAERARQREQMNQEAWAAATGYSVRISLETRWPPPYGGLSLDASAMPLQTEPQQSRFSGDPSTRLGVSASPRDDELRWAEQTPERRAEWAKDPVVGARQRVRLSLKPRAQAPYDRGDYLGRLQELLPDLARTYEVGFISDSYWTSPPIFADAVQTTEPEALYRLLERPIGFTHRWERRGKLIRLRSRTWFFDRPREVPLRLVRRWNDMAAKQGGLPLDEYVTMVTTLTDLQLETVSSRLTRGVLPAEMPELSELYRNRHVLRLYASFTPAQRQALWQGKAIPGAQLRPEQRYLYAAQGQSELETRPPDVHSIDWSAVGFALSSEPVTRPGDPPAGARPETGRAVPERAPSAPTAGAPQVSAPPANDPPQGDAGASRQRLLLLKLEFQYNGRTTTAVSLPVAAPS